MRMNRANCNESVAANYTTHSQFCVVSRNSYSEIIKLPSTALKSIVKSRFRKERQLLEITNWRETVKSLLCIKIVARISRVTLHRPVLAILWKIAHGIDHRGLIMAL